MLLNQSNSKCRCSKTKHTNVICSLCRETVCTKVASFCHCPRILCKECFFDIDYCDGCGDNFT